MEMNKQSRINSLNNIKKLRTDTDLIAEAMLTCDEQLVRNTVVFVRSAFKPYEFKPLKERFAQCSHCGKLHNVEAMVTSSEGNMFCANCVSVLHKCECCGGYSESPIGRICTSCAETHVICENCGAIVTRGEHNEIEQHVYCRSCFDDLTVCCAECDERILRSNARFYDGRAYCVSCFNEEEFRGKGLIHDYGFKPNYPSYGLERRFGVELEFEGSRTAACDLVDNIQGIYCKHDGSLDDGFEVVTDPMLLDTAISTCMEIGRVAKKSDLSGSNGTCGIHVHVSRAGITDEAETVSKMLILFSRFEDRISKFARRSSGRWAEVSKKSKDEHDRDPKRFLDVERSTRYRAINLCNDRTIEFRIFKGTNNGATIAAIILFCNAFIDYCEALDFNKVEEVSWTDVFADKSTDPKYAHLFTYMQDKGLC